MSLFLVFFFLYFVPAVIANSMIITNIRKDPVNRTNGYDELPAEYFEQFIPALNIACIIYGLYTSYQEYQEKKHAQLVDEIVSQINKKQEKSDD
jgi:hypothetical protein